MKLSSSQHIIMLEIFVSIILVVTSSQSFDLLGPGSRLHHGANIARRTSLLSLSLIELRGVGRQHPGETIAAAGKIKVGVLRDLDRKI